MDRLFPKSLAFLFSLAVVVAGAGMWLHVRGLAPDEPTSAGVVADPAGDGSGEIGGGTETEAGTFASGGLAGVSGIFRNWWEGRRDAPEPASGARPGPVQVVLDPGHGGADGGTVVFGLLEKDLVLDLGLRTAIELRRRGIGVALTRERDQWVNLEDRAGLAREHPGALFVSLHLNRYSSPSVRGVEAFVHTPARALVVPTEDGGSLRFHDERSAELGRRLTAAISEQCGLRDRGVKESRLLLARQAPAPAVVLECAYLSNPGEAWQISRSEFRQGMAVAIADALEEFIKDSGADPLLGLAPWDERRSRRRSDLIRVEGR